MKAKITVSLDNDAFSGGPGEELARILRDLARTIEDCDYDDFQHYTLRDKNGNRVGDFDVT